MNQHYIIVMIAIVCLAIFKRARRNIGWQKFQPSKMLIRMVVFFIIGALLLFENIIHPIAFISDIAGAAIGLILAYYGISSTTFEKRGEDWYYRNNPWIGGIVTALFFGRLIYRFYMMFSLAQHAGGRALQQSNSLQNMMHTGSSWTAGLIMIMFAYYAAYCMMLLRKRKSQSIAASCGAGTYSS
ncbi:putative flippase GtrA [Scopulibacillus daqui]|uniref:Flippase GtrA n=1 Tax=Scopulibacillus daqui TaxID=1469162 RepID=A0ABS2Q5G6_9BACL|nr:CcdC protein domain-containing protein [Scopulibacillus daqui]MBM7646939.1 putative flippase GtrA [Scopulibacillus daqui]